MSNVIYDALVEKEVNLTNDLFELQLELDAIEKEFEEISKRKATAELMVTQCGNDLDELKRFMEEHYG